MRVPQRARVFLSLCLAVLLGVAVLGWGVGRVSDIRSAWRFDYPDEPSIPWALVQLGVAGVLVLAVLAGLTVWCGRPLGELGASVRRFGPQNLAERTGAASHGGRFGALAGDVDAMLDRVAEGYEAQRRFAANASHELRTPLAVQRTLVEVGLTGDPTPDQLAVVTRQLLATNERNEALIDGLLALAETDQTAVVQVPQRLDALAADVAAVHHQVAAAGGVALRTELAPVTVAGEAALLERLVANLVHNAIKYNVPGGEVRLAVGPAQPVLRVTNTGPVVPAESVPALFEPFRRARGDRLDHAGGVGLGLTIARSIVRAHGGRITATAPPTGGLHVVVELAPLG